MEYIIVAYVKPDYITNHEFDEWENMTLEDMRAEWGVVIFTLDEFQSAFNNYHDCISDLGYIFFYKTNECC